MKGSSPIVAFQLTFCLDIIKGSTMRPSCVGLFLLVLPASLYAAPIPVDNETAKPRAKLSGTLTLDQNIRQVLWTPDGSALVVQTGKNMVLVYKRDQVLKNETKPKPLAAFELPADTHIRIHAATNTLYGVRKAQHLCSESRYYSWNLQPLLEGLSPTKPDRMVALDIDNFDDVSLSDDGRRLFVQMTERMGGGSSIWDQQNRQTTVRMIPHLLRFSTKTGDKVDEAWTVNDEGKFHRHLTHDTASGRLYATHVTSEEISLQAMSLGNEKIPWERKIEGKECLNMQCYSKASGSSGLIVFGYCELLERPEPQQGPPVRGQRPQMQRATRMNLLLLNAKTGETIHKLSEDDTTAAHSIDFSFDGQLFLGKVRNSTGNSLNVWNTSTGKVLKSWNQDLYASYQGGQNSNTNLYAFSPKAQELATLCLQSKHLEAPATYTPPIGHGQTNWTQTPNVLRTDYTTTIGLWDFSTLVK